MKRELEQIRTDLAKNLRASRKNCGLSQEALALAANVDRTYVSQIERATGNPSIAVVSKLAQVLGLDIIELLSE